MQICLIIDNPETPHHPIIASVVQKLSVAHTVCMLDVREITGVEEEQHPHADLYLLKSHAPQALYVARILEQRGALVVNSRASTLICQDRLLLSQRMEEAALPWPKSLTFSSLEQLLKRDDLLAALKFPLIIKSRYSRRGDLVAKMDSSQQLRAYASQWSQEPIVLQQFLAGDGWDIKLWVIDEQIFAARRRSPLAGKGKENFPIAQDALLPEWVRIAREIGRLFQLRLYGIDLLETENGPVIVDVNSFPGFRGVPDADEALVQLVERIGAEHAGVRNAGQEQTNLFVRYLRHKPGRNLVVVYNVDKRQPGGKHRDKAAVYRTGRAISVTLDESALQDADMRFVLEQAKQAALHITTTGSVQANTLGIAAQTFPADAALPTLATCCDTTPQSQLMQALERAAQQQTGDPRWKLVAASTQPVRYKPGNRCVIRYRLTLEKLQEGEAVQKTLTLYGKVYADVEQAHNVQAMMQALYEEQVSAGEPVPLLPAPLGASGIAGLVFNEAIQPQTGGDEPANRVRTGNECFRFQAEYRQGGEMSRVLVTEKELQLTARALAQLHTSALQPGKKRTAAQEARRTGERAALLASHSPRQADEIVQLAQRLVTTLEGLQPESYRPAHGGFKPSQLLFHSQRAFVVDFDGLCLADPALDIGYFLAYLRPSSLWYHRPGMREWFEASSNLFVDAYSDAMSVRGVSAQEIESSLARAKLYEAALLFKIATRRVHRLNSPRPGELSAMLDEVAHCLSKASQMKRDRGGQYAFLLYY